MSNLLFSSPEQLEARMVYLFAKSCVICGASNPTRWYYLCTRHAPIVRAIIDPTYLPWLRDEKRAAEERLAMYLKIRPVMENALERIHNGNIWVNEQTDPVKQEQGREKIRKLVEEIPEGFRSFADLAPLDFLIEATKRQITLRDAAITHIGTASKEILDMLS